MSDFLTKFLESINDVTQEEIDKAEPKEVVKGYDNGGDILSLYLQRFRAAMVKYAEGLRKELNALPRCTEGMCEGACAVSRREENYLKERLQVLDNLFWAQCREEYPETRGRGIALGTGWEVLWRPSEEERAMQLVCKIISDKETVVVGGSEMETSLAN